MRKNVLLAFALVLLGTSSVSSQSFLKKLGNSAKKVVGTEETTNNSKPVNQADAFVPIALAIESTRIIGDKLLISGKMIAPEDFRLMRVNSSIITPDGTTYEAKVMWWGEEALPPSALDKNIVADINYAFDLSFDIKSKKVTEIVSFVFDAFNHTAQKTFKITLKNLIVPNPINPELSNPSVNEIYKNIYIRWTSIEESENGLKINYVIENKNDNDQKMQFPGYSTIGTTIIDNNGTSHEAKNSMECNIIFPSGVPIAGSITLDKPIKVSQIALLEFASRNFNYRIKGIVLP